MAEDLLAKLPKSSDRYTIKFVSDYYEKLSLSENFELVSITEGYMFNVLKNVEVAKVAGIDKNVRKIFKKWSANFGKTY